MNFTTILDISSLIWNRADYETNTHNYYRLADSLLDLLGKLENQKTVFLMRKQLLDRIDIEFPFYELSNDFRDFIDAIYKILSKIGLKGIDYPDNIDDDLISEPNLIKEYYNDETKVEIRYLISRMHSDEDSDKIYFTFNYLWDGDNSFLVVKDTTKNVLHPVVVSDNEDKFKNNELDIFLDKFKRVFEHHVEKHDRITGQKNQKGEPVSKLSCFDGKDETVPQKLLDEGEKSGKRIYNYDDENEVWVVFMNHEGNKYHGYDEEENEVPPKVKKRLNKYVR